MTKKMRTGLLAMAIIGLALMLAACGANDNNNADGTQSNNGNTVNNNATDNASDNVSDNSTNDNAGEELSGNVETAGSSTVYPMMLAMAEWYTSEQPNVNVTVDSVGSGGGFKESTSGNIDFSNASRPIKDEEVELAEENGIHLEPLTLAYDGLTIAVSAENDFVDNVSLDDLKAIFLADSGNTKWSDVNPDWPDETIEIFAPGHDSGTFDYFNEVILEDSPMREDENTTLSEDDNILVRGISNNEYAIGFFGYAYYIQNEDTLKALSVDGVAPNMDTIQSGEYSPLSRPLFTYLNANELERPEVYDFAQFVLDHAGESAELVGYVPLSDEEYAELKATVDELAGK